MSEGGDVADHQADSCDSATGCVFTPIAGCCTDDAFCDDGDVCNGVETCDNGTCLPGTNAPAGTLCDNGGECDGNGTCVQSCLASGELCLVNADCCSNKCQAKGRHKIKTCN